MATLIQSKQIEGIVTASVVTGEFLVSGSLIVTGSNSILGSVTASAISSSFIGDGSGITGITYSQVENTPTFVGGNNITITSSSNVITFHAQLDGTGSDTQSLTIDGDQLTILGGNTITIPTGSNVSDYFELSNIPEGIVSSSIQILGGSGILSGSKTDITSLNTFSSSIQSEVDSLTAATSSYLTSSGSVDFSDVTNKPSGLVSSSDQITITESQISDLTHYGDSDVKTKLDVEGVVSGSYVESLPQGVISGSEQLPSGLISGSSQITITQSQISDLAHTDVTNLNTFTSSIQSEVDSLTSATSSYITEIPQGTISGSQQVIDSLPSGVVSGSSQITITESQISDLAHTQIPLGTISGSEQLPSGLISSSDQITITESQISDLSHYSDSDVQSYIDSLGVVSGSVVAELPSGVVSGSQQVVDSLPSGIISGSEQFPQGLISGSEQLPSGLVSSSAQITITESQISDLTHTDISQLNQFTSSLQSEVDSLTAATSSYLTSIDSGIVSSSAQVTELLPDGVVSGSSQITITESQISDLTHYTDSDVKSKLDAEGVVSGSVIREIPQGTISGSEQLPSGLVSGSTQITDGSGIVSSSVQVISHLPQGTVSGSAQTIANLPSGVVSGSFSGSVATAIDLLQEVSGANYIESQSVDSRLDIIEGSFGNYYDVSNTVWNNKYIRPGSEYFSDVSLWNTNENKNLFTFTLNRDRKLYYEEGKIVYINNFDGDVRLTVTPVTGSDGVYYNTGSREVTFRVLEINSDSDTSNITRINDSYWILSRHTAGFVDSGSYTETSASIDEQFKAIANAGAGADWDVNLFNIPQGIISASVQLYSASVEAGIALTSSLDTVSSSLADTIENVYLSSSNFDAKSLVSGSSQIDFREVTNYVADEHIDHTTININAGDGLDGGGDISSTRELRLNVTSSHFTSGVGDVLTTEGVVKQSTLDTDIAGTDFSQSVDTRLNSISSGLVPAGTVSGSTQIDIEQTQNFTNFSSSIATSIAGVSGETTDISHLNTFTSSVQSQVDELIISSSTFLTSETDSQTLSIVGDQLTISSGNSVTIPTGSGTADFTQLTNVPSGLVSSSEQILGGSGILSGSKTDISSLNTFSGSIQSTVDALVAATSSYLTSETDNQTLSIVGDQLTISDGNTITIPTGSGESIDTGSFATTGSNTFSGSQFITGSIIPEASGGNGLHDLGSTSNPFRELYVTTGSVQFVKDGNVISRVSGEDNAIRVGNILITTSSIEVVNNTGQIVKQLVQSKKNSEIDVDADLVLPPDLLSGSLIPGTNITIDSSSGDYIISSTASGVGDVSFDGDRIITNTLLGDLYSQSFNAGTSGTVQDFLNALFFPSYAPTATFSTQTSNLNTNLATVNGVIETFTLTDEDDNTPYSVTISGTDASSFTLVPQNAASSSWELQAATDLSAGTYTYDLTITDSNGDSVDYTDRSVTIAQAGSGTLSTNGTLYIIESATTGPIYINSNGRSGTSAVTSVSYSPNYGSQVATNFQSSNSLISVNPTTGLLSVGDPISGSGNLSPRFISATITWNDQYGNTDSSLINVNVTKNNAPTVSSTQTFNTNTNQATGSSEIVRLSLTDVESDSIPSTGLSWSGYNSTYFTPSNSTGVMKLLVNSTSIPAGEYGYTASIEDIHGFDTTIHSGSVTIAQADNGTLIGDTSIYIIESALRNDLFRDASGYNNGNAAQVSVSYSPNYGSQAVQSFNSTNPAIQIDSSGNMSLGVDISGSATGSGDTFTSTITFTDQYGNSDTGTVTATVFANNAPSANFTANSLNSDEAIDGADIGSVTVSDTEGNTPFTVTLGGTDGSKFRVVGSTSPFEIQPTESLTGGTYSIDITVTDSVGKSATLTSETIVVDGVDTANYGTVYVYTSTFGSDAGFASNYLGVMGGATVNSDVPPEVTSYTANTLSPFFTLKGGSIGDNSITLAASTSATLRATISGDTTLDSALQNNGSIFGSGTSQIILVYPSGSDMVVPTSIQETINGVSGGGVPYLNIDSAGWGIQSAQLHSIVLDTPHLGFSEWYVLGRQTRDGIGSSFEYRIIDSDGGSAPS